ncbi:hypothetical protein DV515_00014710 [Chloebia gouldiae]|uniref:Uncharacterized protein n=1 Tax=Chloebia gouldiae TaxID=44316 RepID=A0A3L8RYI9_CHLGU|nr:hypothetical protein DV515_00014710 [Chloebia gouldiae]
MEMLAVAQHSPVLSIYSFEEHREDDREGSTGPWWESTSLPPDSCSSQDSEHNGITTKQWCCNRMLEGCQPELQRPQRCMEQSCCQGGNPARPFPFSTPTLEFPSTKFSGHLLDASGHKSRCQFPVESEVDSTCLGGSQEWQQCAGNRNTSVSMEGACSAERRADGRM